MAAVFTGQPPDNYRKPDEIRVEKEKIFGNSNFFPAVQNVILRFQNGHYVVDTDLMRKPPMTPDQLWARAREIRSMPWPGTYSHDWPWTYARGRSGFYELQNSMVALTYSGHADQARQLLDMAWPLRAEGKSEFIGEFFRCRLRASRYWEAIAAMNNLPAEPPDWNYCPF